MFVRPSLTSYHGKISYFWPSISSYLDPCNTGATYINSIKTNTSLATISGSNVVCESGTSFQLNHELGDATVTWEVTPTNLFSSPISGTGSNPTVYANSNSNTGSGQINFYVSCDTCTKNVWVGIPENGLSGAYIVGPSCIEKGSTNNYFHGSPHPMIIGGATSYNWSVHPYDANIVI